MTDDEGAAHAKLPAEFRALEAEYERQDEFPQEVDARLGALEFGMEKLEARPLIFEEVARPGAIVTLDPYGELAFHRGFFRPEDQPREEIDVHSGEPVEDGQGGDVEASASGNAGGAMITFGGQALGETTADEEDDGTLKLLPERLLSGTT